MYNYDTPAALSTVTGQWTVTDLEGETVSLNIGTSGSFTAAGSRGCNFSGNVTPRPSGKNVFNVTVTFGGAPCSLPGQSGSGIAVAYPIDGGRTQLLMAAVTAPNSSVPRHSAPGEASVRAFANGAPRVALTGKVNKLEFSSSRGLTGGSWTIDLTLSSSNGKALTVNEYYEFNSGFAANEACRNTAEAFSRAVQNLVGKTVRNPAFASLVA